MNRSRQVFWLFALVLPLAAHCSSFQRSIDEENGQPDDEDPPGAEVVPIVEADYTVHEWGVFTEDGVHSGPRLWGDITARKPVLYFYSDSELTTDIDVAVVPGEVSETWPEVDLGEDVSWPEVRISADPCSAYSPFPEPGQGQCEEPAPNWCEATELASYVVPEASCLSQGTTQSPLLFYAADLAVARLPIEGGYIPSDPEAAEAERAVQVSLTNIGHEAVGPLFLIFRDIEGECWEPYGGCRIDGAEVGILWLDSLEEGGEVDVLIETENLAALADSGYVEPPEWLTDQEQRIADALVEAGLTAAEARAFLAGWRHTFLDLMPDDNMISVPLGPSLAVVSFIAPELYDRILPIQLNPYPRDFVRVGVGYQYLPPADCDGCDADATPECS